MAALFLLQFLLFGTLLVPAYLQTDGCNSLQNAVASNFSVTVTPEAYVANTTYQVTISDDRNLTAEQTVTKYFLQAIHLQNTSVGEWSGVEKQNCSGIETAALNATQNSSASWTSPESSNISSVEIRAYIVFVNNSTEFKTVTLQKETELTTSPTTTGAASAVQSCSLFISVLQLLMLLGTNKLLS